MKGNPGKKIMEQLCPGLLQLLYMHVYILAKNKKTPSNRKESAIFF
jgi:hypothetical protein